MYWCVTVVTLTDCVLDLECHSSYRLYWCATVVTDCIGVPQQLQTVLVCHSSYRLCIGVPQCVLLHQLLQLRMLSVIVGQNC